MSKDSSNISDIEKHEDSLTKILKGMSLEDLPDSLFVSNLSEEIFSNKNIKDKFESTFKNYNSIQIYYFENFRRCRVYFKTPYDAAKARIALHQLSFNGTVLKLSFPEVQLPSTSEPNLQLPQLEKFFLISPPASPPVGWEPIIENEPVVDIHLISALANLQPGKAHQLYEGTDSTPSVVVHVCETVDNGDVTRIKIPQTRRPNC